MKWQPYELAIDLLVVSKQLTVDLEKYLNISMEAPAKRVRAISKYWEKLGRSFRIQSVKSTAKKIKNSTRLKNQWPCPYLPKYIDHPLPFMMTTRDGNGENLMTFLSSTTILMIIL